MSGYNRLRQPFGPYKLTRLYGISEKKAKLHRDGLMRLSLMKPEGRRYMLKLILQGETHAS